MLLLWIALAPAMAPAAQFSFHGVSDFFGTTIVTADGSPVEIWGTITIDTDVLAAAFPDGNVTTYNHSSGSAIGTSFLSATIYSNGISGTPILLSSGASDQLIDYNPDPDFGGLYITLGYEQENGGIFTRSVLNLTTNTPLPTILIGGVLLPDLSQASDLYFDVSSSVGPNGAEETLFAGGLVDALAIAAVPEPATWALVIIGFGAIGAGTRRRRTDAAGRALSKAC